MEREREQGIPRGGKRECSTYSRGMQPNGSLKPMFPTLPKPLMSGSRVI